MSLDGFSRGGRGVNGELQLVSAEHLVEDEGRFCFEVFEDHAGDFSALDAGAVVADEAVLVSGGYDGELVEVVLCTTLRADAVVDGELERPFDDAVGGC